MRTLLLRTALALVVVVPATAQAAAQQQPNPFVRIPAGEMVPFYGDGTPRRVAAFELQRDLVSVREFASFLEKQPRWKPENVARVHADAGYLRDWTAAVPEGDAPVVNVSWFAARAYCASIGGRLPSTLEWEYVGVASAGLRDASADPAFRSAMLQSYTSSTSRTITAASANWYGIRGMHGSVREWVVDFNSIMTSDDSRSTKMDRGMYCAAAASGTRDPSDYAAFLRYALRASLTPRSTTANLGFRCAR